MTRFKSLDSFLIDQPTSDKVRERALDAASNEKNSKLKVTIDATHSGVLTNKRVYPALKVQKGFKSFFSKESGGDAEFDKPVLKHHDMYDDPIGRVVKATFTPLKSGRQFDEDYLTPDPLGSKGSGVVTVDTIITDPESIQKIIDGRYISVSAGHSTDKMTCSICDKSILTCDHWPGKHYNEEGEVTDAENGFLCFYITGDMTYEELSFVNMPAQPPAKLVNFRWEDHQKDDFTKDSLLIKSMTRGKKSMVRDFTFVDDDGEINLLKGLYQSSTGKVSVAMATSASGTSKSNEENNDVPHTKDKKDSSAKEDNIANSNKSKVKKMNENDKDTEGLDVNTLKASLKALTDERDRLSADKEEKDEKITGLESKISSLTSEIDTLTKANTDTQVELCKALATALTAFRVQLKKPGTDELSDTEKFDDYVNKLSERSADSLKDAISDIAVEISEVKEDEPVKDSKDKKINGDKLSSPVQKDSANKIVRAGGETPSKTQDDRSALDKAFD